MQMKLLRRCETELSALLDAHKNEMPVEALMRRERLRTELRRFIGKMEPDRPVSKPKCGVDKEAYREGKKAFASGKSLSSYPYAGKNLRVKSSWLAGFTDAREEAEAKEVSCGCAQT